MDTVKYFANGAKCVLVATTLLHSGAKFHCFLYTGSKTVRLNMESCYGGMSTRLKQRAVTEFLKAENVTPAEIHRRLQAVYGENTVNRTTVNRWAIKFRECEPGRANIVDQPRSGRPVSVTDDKHQKQVDDTVCNAACSIAHSIICTVRLFRGKMHSDWFNGIEILQDLGSMEKKWDTVIPADLKGLFVK